MLANMTINYIFKKMKVAVFSLCSFSFFVNFHYSLLILPQPAVSLVLVTSRIIPIYAGPHFAFSYTEILFVVKEVNLFTAFSSA